MSELKTCNYCKHEMLEEYFSKNKKGILYKTCDRCKERQKNYRNKYMGSRECEKCNYKCSTKTELNRHIKSIHDKIRDIICDKCNRKFKRKDTLYQHIKTVHDKIYNYNCDKCKYKCSSNRDLKIHIKSVHDKIKDIKCDKCEYTCSKKSHLSNHLKICTGNTNMSSGEYKVSQTLDEMGIQYKREVSIDLGTSGRLRWDFVINHNNKDYFIEYDGTQHFRPVRFAGMSVEKSEALFNTTQTHDKLKNDYCNDNELILLRIKYTDYGNIPNILTDFAIKHFDWDGDKH